MQIAALTRPQRRATTSMRSQCAPKLRRPHRDLAGTHIELPQELDECTWLSGYGLCMTWSKAVLIFLYAASALLPVLGLMSISRSAVEVRNRLSVGQDPKDPDILKFGIVGLITTLALELKERPDRVRRDLLMIGSGVICGSAASIWSLFL